jgi:hypothetical protein
LSEPIARKFLKLDADRLAEVSGSLFENRDAYGEELSTFYDERKVYFRSLMDGVEITEPHMVFTTSILMAGQAKLLANTPLNMITANFSLVHYLVHNIKPADGRPPTRHSSRLSTEPQISSHTKTIPSSG